MNRLRVLHVVECYSGGVATAVGQYVRSTPELDHHLLRRIRPGEQTDDSDCTGFSSVQALPSSFFEATRTIRKMVRRLQPDLVHAHSSFAGAFVRLAMPTGRPCPIVYTPHGYSFERRDIPAAARLGFHSLEWLLAWNTEVIAACSPREAALSAGFHSRRSTVHVPNVAVDIPAGDPRSGGSGVRAPLVIAGAGRLTAARDPEFFGRTVELARRERPEVKAIWVGGGDERMLQDLAQHGVEVTGWLSRTEALARLRAADVYLHTAAWDGFPMAILEAHALGLPILARTSPALSDAGKLGIEAGVQAKEADLAAALVRLADEEQFRSQLLDEWSTYLRDHSPDNQRRQLLSGYRTALAASAEPARRRTFPAIKLGLFK